MQAHLLNHASILLDLSSFNLLFDPWFEGTAFAGSWGLKYHNPNAYARAQKSDALWISHWHSDHFHPPTLKNLAALNPDIKVYANKSANFSMGEKIRELGFKNVIPMPERKWFELNSKNRMMRIPTAGIDNLLILESESLRIINYNDCNLPRSAIKKIVRKYGKADLLLVNYNHASKLYDNLTDKEIKQDLIEKLVTKADLFEAKQVIPFASFHYYRSPFSQSQNNSLLNKSDLELLAARDSRFQILMPGDSLNERQNFLPIDIDNDIKDYGPSASWEELSQVAKKYCERLSKEFSVLKLWADPLCIEISDYEGKKIILDLKKGKVENAPKGQAAHIRAHSKGLVNWLGRPFGDDSFFAGADFELISQNTVPIRKFTLMGFLSASHLSVKPALKMAFTPHGLQFLFNRREEIWATATEMKFRAGESRL